MKVYIVLKGWTSPENDDMDEIYDVEKVFTSQEKAIAYCFEKDDCKNYESYRVISRDLEE